MRLTAIKLKSTGQIIGTIEPGVWFELPDGLKQKDVEFDIILIPEHGELVRQNSSAESDAVGNMARHLGMEIADFIELCAKLFGIPPCSSCQVAKLILYSIRGLGWIKAGKLIIKTKLGLPYSRKEQLVIDTLKQRVNGVS